MPERRSESIERVGPRSYLQVTAPQDRRGKHKRGFLKRRGVNYDVCIEFSLGYSRPEFDASVARRELEIIRSALHCNAVRISGTDPDRLAIAAEIAL